MRESAHKLVAVDGRIDAKTAKRRARAMWAWYGKPQAAFAKAAGLSYDELRGILSPRDARGTVAVGDLLAMARAAGVPSWFAEDGWDWPAGTSLATPEVARRLARLEEELAELTGRRGSEEVDLAGALDQPPGESGRAAGEEPGDDAGPGVASA